MMLLSVPRNYDPALHPFEAPREYSQAMNAVKLEKVFAKPFIGDLEGHKDVVNCMCKHPSMLSHILSGAGDGEVRIAHLFCH
jgi:WD repeat and SOF domain-containing protein 1